MYFFVLKTDKLNVSVMGFNLYPLYSTCNTYTVTGVLSNQIKDTCIYAMLVFIAF